MNFSSIIYKNFRHNFKKYLSYYLVNSFIVSVLFMYGSLMFNEKIVLELGRSTIFQTMKIAFWGIVLFSIVFISYTSICFIKYRGKEFGVFLTLGMTTKNLIKVTVLENIAIIIASLATGIITGGLFSRLFYMVIGKVLQLQQSIYEINYKTFLLSIGIVSVIFIANLIFTSIYLYRISVIKAIKSSSKKEISEARPILGVIAVVILIIAMYLFPKALLNQLPDNKNIIIGFSIAATMICPYIIIGSFITLFIWVAKKFPNFYNKNLLVLSNLSHRFLGYKTVLYVVSLLVAGAIFFIGITYTGYKSVSKNNDKDYPYEFMFVESGKYNNISKEEVKKIIENNNGTIEQYAVLEYLTLHEYREIEDEIQYWSEHSVIISETNYNKHMGTSYDVSENEIISVDVYNEKMSRDKYNIIFSLDEQENTDKRFDESFRMKIKEFKSEPFIDSVYTKTYSAGDASIVDDKGYEEMVKKVGENKISKYHLINLKNGDKDKIFEALLSGIRRVNTNDETVWQSKTNVLGGKYDERSLLEAYRPIYKMERFQVSLQENGFAFFSFIFLGILFLVASAVVLYYKVISDIEEEKERMISISKIGLTDKEGSIILIKQLRIIFFTPVIVGGGLGFYYLFIMYSNSSLTVFLMKQTLIVIALYAILQMIFFFGLKRKYLNEVL